jgi:hypothetical protein
MWVAYRYLHENYFLSSPLDVLNHFRTGVRGGTRPTRRDFHSAGALSPSYLFLLRLPHHDPALSGSSGVLVRMPVMSRHRSCAGLARVRHFGVGPLSLQTPTLFRPLPDHPSRPTRPVVATRDPPKQKPPAGAPRPRALVHISVTRGVVGASERPRSSPRCSWYWSRSSPPWCFPRRPRPRYGHASDCYDGDHDDEDEEEEDDDFHAEEKSARRRRRSPRRVRLGRSPAPGCDVDPAPDALRGNNRRSRPGDDGVEPQPSRRSEYDLVAERHRGRTPPTTHSCPHPRVVVARSPWRRSPRTRSAEAMKV